MAGPRGPRQSPLRASDDAVSDVLGEMLVVAILLGLFAVSAVAFLPDDPPTSLNADVQVRAECGAGGWGTGDERVVVEHVGGRGLEQARTGIRVLVDDADTDHSLGTLGGAFADGEFIVGERWDATVTAPAGADVRVRVFYLHDDGEVGLWRDLTVKTRTCGTA